MKFSEKVKDLVQSYQSCEFVLMNRGIMKELGINQTIVLSELLSKFNYHASKNELCKDGSFYCTTEKLEDLTTLSYKQQKPVIEKLEQSGFIKVKKGRGNVRYFIIVIDAVKELIKKFSKVVEKKKKVEQKEKKVQKEKKDKKESVQNGNSRNDKVQDTEMPKRKFSINKKKFIKIKYKKHNKSSSSKKIYREEKKMDYVFQSALEGFLQTNGFSGQMIKETVKQFVSRGISMFKLPDLKNAYDKMMEYDANVRKVIYPPVFFANGVSMILPKTKKVQVSEPEPRVIVPLYNWLDN